MTIGKKNTALIIGTFVGKVMSLVFNMLSSDSIFLSGSKVLITFSFREQGSNLMAAITICSDFGAQGNKVFHCLHCFPIYLPWSDGTGSMTLVFWMLSFKSTFFTFIKRLFSSSSLSAIRMILSAYLRLLIFLLAILIPACASSSPAFHMMYSIYKLNK